MSTPILGDVVDVLDLADHLIKMVTDLVGLEKAKASLDKMYVQEANVAADLAELQKFKQTSGEPPSPF
jgi:hypothetical protein